MGSPMNPADDQQDQQVQSGHGKQRAPSRRQLRQAVWRAGEEAAVDTDGGQLVSSPANMSSLPRTAVAAPLAAGPASASLRISLEEEQLLTGGQSGVAAVDVDAASRGTAINTLGSSALGRVCEPRPQNSTATFAPVAMSDEEYDPFQPEVMDANSSEQPKKGAAGINAGHSNEKLSMTKNSGLPSLPAVQQVLQLPSLASTNLASQSPAAVAGGHDGSLRASSPQAGKGVAQHSSPSSPPLQLDKLAQENPVQLRSPSGSPMELSDHSNSPAPMSAQTAAEPNSSSNLHQPPSHTMPASQPLRSQNENQCTRRGSITYLEPLHPASHSSQHPPPSAKQPILNCRGSRSPSHTRRRSKSRSRSPVPPPRLAPEGCHELPLPPPPHSTQRGGRPLEFRPDQARASRDGRAGARVEFPLPPPPPLERPDVRGSSRDSSRGRRQPSSPRQSAGQREQRQSASRSADGEGTGRAAHASTGEYGSQRSARRGSPVYDTLAVKDSSRRPGESAHRSSPDYRPTARRGSPVYGAGGKRDADNSPPPPPRISSGSQPQHEDGTGRREGGARGRGRQGYQIDQQRHNRMDGDHESVSSGNGGHAPPNAHNGRSHSKDDFRRRANQNMGSREEPRGFNQDADHRPDGSRATTSPPPTDRHGRADRDSRRNPHQQDRPLPPAPPFTSHRERSDGYSNRGGHTAAVDARGSQHQQLGRSDRHQRPDMHGKHAFSARPREGLQGGDGGKQWHIQDRPPQEARGPRVRNGEGHLSEGPDQCRRGREDNEGESGMNEANKRPRVETRQGAPLPAPAVPTPAPQPQMSSADIVRAMMAPKGQPGLEPAAGAMTREEKIKLLWGAKKKEAVVAATAEQVQADIVFGANRWDAAQFDTDNDKSKFQRLMGVKPEVAAVLTGPAPPPVDEVAGHVAMKKEEQTVVLQQMEEQYRASTKRFENRTLGLGMG